ncbi:MAG: divergent PAP2 family protein [Endozoicomonas sp.]
MLLESGFLLGNKILDVVLVAWFCAQFYKVISALLLDGQINIKRLWDTGGMPSSHSATVTSLATCVGLIEGWGSTEFAMATIFASVVMYDAAGIRRAAGKQAGVLNKILERLTHKIEERIHDERLKELLGHTPFEVVIGATLGIAMAFLLEGYLLG